MRETHTSDSTPKPSRPVLYAEEIRGSETAVCCAVGIEGRPAVVGIAGATAVVTAAAVDGLAGAEAAWKHA